MSALWSGGFEGLKAYRTAEGKIQLFRPDENFKRLNTSNKRMVIPEIPVDDALEALTALLNVEKDWVPHTEGASLYIRPFIIATDPYVGVRPADHYLFMIILSPSGAYYSTGLNPVKIYVESNYVRAVRGGTGFVKQRRTMPFHLQVRTRLTSRTMNRFSGWTALSRNILKKSVR